MKKTVTKIIALCLCAALVAGGNAATAFALNGKTPTAKDETVYVLAGADGAARKLIVSDWLQNTAGAASLEDRTDLTNVENVKGDEGFTLGDNGVCVWDAQGNDIYYQGNLEKDLPVDMSITYTLDGQSVTAAELAGKSGEVTIRFDYTNRQYEYVELDGRQEKIYVPFAMLTGVLLDNDVFTNVEVSNGRLVDDGSRTAVVGIAFPGLQENLGISEEQAQIPDYVEITADAENFELGMTLTVATNEPFSEIDMGSFDTVSDLSESMGELTDAMDQLLDGTAQLYDGLSTLLEKSGELVEGVGQLAAGAEALKTGAGSLDEGAAALQAGAVQLYEGLNTLESNHDALNGGAQQIFETLLATADTQLAAAGLEVPALTIQNYADVLNGVIASLSEDGVRQQVTAAEEGAQSVAALKASLDSFNTFYVGLQTYTAGVSDAATGAGTLMAGTDDLKAGTSELYAGACELSDGITTLQSETPALVDGVTQLRDGTVQLSDGLKELYEQGIQKLVDAVNEDLEGLVARFRATSDVSADYRNFAGTSEGMDGQVRFIYRTDSIQKAD